MSFEGFKTAMIELVREHIRLAEPLVFIMGFAEGIPGLSFLVPSTALFLAIGGIHSAAGGTFVPMWIAASVGAILGDLVVYWLARLYKDEVARLPVFNRYPGWLTQGRLLFAKWGVLTIVVGKFLGFMRPFVPAVAGVLEMPLWQFVPASVLSSFAWAGIFLAPGYGIIWLAS